MNNNVYKIVTHGLGPENDLVGLLTLGLNANPTFSGLSARTTNVKERIPNLDVDERYAMYLPSLILFDDYSVMLFDDSSRAMWDTGDSGTPGKVKSRLGALEVQRG